MTDRTAPASPRLKARIAGAFYLITIVAGVAGLATRSNLIVRGDAAATAHNIMASEALFRAGVSADLIGTAAYVGVTAMLYGLLKPVSPSLSRLAAFFSLVGCAIGAAVTTCFLAPVLLLGGAAYLAPFTQAQLQALSLLALKVHGQGYNIAMINFGFYCALLGYLIFRSGFFPRFVGVLMLLAGAGWFVDCFATILSPEFERSLSSYALALGFIGEASLMLWLLVVGLDPAKWEAAAARR